MRKAVILLTLVFVSFFFVFVMFADTPGRSVEVSESFTIQDTVTVEHIIPYIEIARNISLINSYDINKYNCWDYSTDLKRALINAGYNDTKIVIGLYDDYPHAWVEVNGIWIESTNGEVIKDKTIYKFGYYGTNKYNPYNLNTKK